MQPLLQLFEHHQAVYCALMFESSTTVTRDITTLYQLLTLYTVKLCDTL